ncbi:aminocarboxymuconate-semialdehyde decarboxylase/hypothetical protein [Verrucomicrobium sp. GAS474]|uniref:amidohydrolase family protein n=1 Tax=Verrucomicrobium sp. GAS474 TaxID=1882831 RepID=UPI00087B171A|nr:amidohydrolase family protein [Verrucomicrobium sp. GAS474]SDT85743.1 aminocarboxymuconate-semialdehyde decarboxylase/hypothetical protein [Verrucomicrobium sp. GAS474]
MAGIVDWHNHWFSPRVVELFSRRTRVPRIVENEKGEKFFLSREGGIGLAQLPIALGFLSVEERLRRLDASGVERQVISWPTTLGTDALLSAEEAKPLWKAYNEDLSALVEAHPDRLLGLAILPTSDIEWAAVELERAHRELGLLGATLPVGAFFTLEGARKLAPIFEVAQRCRSHLYLHTGPASPAIPGQLRFPDAGLEEPGRQRWLLDSYTQFAGAIFTLTLTGFLKPYPDVTIQIAMLGGSISFLVEGIEDYAHRSGQGPADPRSALRRVYLDTGVVGRGPRALALAAETFGADRLLFGSDYPLVDIAPNLRAVEEADLSSHERRQILVGNGEALLASKVRAASKKPGTAVLL